MWPGDSLLLTSLFSLAENPYQWMRNVRGKYKKRVTGTGQNTIARPSSATPSCHRPHPPPPVPRVRFRTLLLPTDCSLRCLSARRAAASFSERRAQRATAVNPDDVRDMSDPTDVASDAATDDAEACRAIPRRRREPCCRLIDVLRAALALVRGTCGIGGRCGRRGGMRDAWGSGGGGVGRGRLLLRSEEEEEAEGFGTPRMCTMPAPSRVSSSVHGFEAVDALDGARATAGATSCQLYVVTLGRTGAGACAEEVNAPNALAMLFRSESRQVSNGTGCWSAYDSSGFSNERSRRSFHRL